MFVCGTYAEVCTDKPRLPISSQRSGGREAPSGPKTNTSLNVNTETNTVPSTAILADNGRLMGGGSFGDAVNWDA
jgi:hypothetical protein